MRVLLDSHLLLWATGEPERLPAPCRRILRDPATETVFSSANIWEIAIKSSLGRRDFQFDPQALRDGLLAANLAEIAISSEHALAAGNLPQIHRDPFDRILVAQALVENITLLTSDPVLGRYPAPVRVF